MRDALKYGLRIVALCGAGAFMLASGACGDDEGEPSPSVTATTGASATGTRTATPGGSASPTDEPFSGGRDPVEVVATPSMDQAHLQDVRAAEHTTFDRFTLEFDIAPPGYKVEYVDPPIVLDPSGQEVTIDGQAFLQITIQGAVASYLSSPGYGGPSELKPGLPNLVEAELTGDFEAVLTWVLGVNEEADFRVLTLESPPRLVVDVGHP
ncbi:MAG TPA: hypothetical protein VGR43_02375 [Dehalococcoidia bacterium]|nr:hypothetical protein [Dehalococcoidia bacterium]